MSKDWAGNRTSTFVQLGASNHSKTEREIHDYYATDPSAIDDLLKKETFNKNIWECACGEGHLSNRLKEYGYKVYSTDLIDRNYQDELVDFLCSNKKFKGDIITNPPYKLCNEFILKALESIDTGNKVAMFLKLTALEGQTRYKKIYSKYPPKTVYVYSKRKQCGKNGVFKGTSAVCYAWFIWKKGFAGCSELKWI